MQSLISRSVRATPAGPVQHHAARNATPHRRRGAMLIVVLVCLPVMLAFSVFVINIAWMQLTRTELRTATDAATRAGSRTLSLTQDLHQARQAAVLGAHNNPVAGDPLLLAPSDLEFGHSDRQANGLWQFAARSGSASDINSVRVTGRRVSGSPSGPVSLLFNGLFDRSTFEPVKVATATHTDRDIVLVLDRSGSMSVAAGQGSRWDALKGAVRIFLQTLQDTPQEEMVGLATYSTGAQIDVNMTRDYQAIYDAVESIEVAGWTAIGAGIQSGRDCVMNPTYARTFASKTIVVMTDGAHNTGVDPEVAAGQAFRNDNIKVHTVTFSSQADRSRMQRTAGSGQGRHWHADDTAELHKAFEEIARNLPTLLTE